VAGSDVIISTSSQWSNNGDIDWGNLLPFDIGNYTTNPKQATAQLQNRQLHNFGCTETLTHTLAHARQHLKQAVRKTVLVVKGRLQHLGCLLVWLEALNHSNLSSPILLHAASWSPLILMHPAATFIHLHRVARRLRALIALE
jgi:hypothetical protein